MSAPSCQICGSTEKVFAGPVNVCKACAQGMAASDPDAPLAPQPMSEAEARARSLAFCLSGEPFVEVDYGTEEQERRRADIIEILLDDTATDRAALWGSKRILDGWTLAEVWAGQRDPMRNGA